MTTAMTKAMTTAIRKTTGTVLASAAAALMLGLPARAGAAESDDQTRLRSRSLAASCAPCHGTDGRALADQSIVRLAGLPAEYTLAQLLAFRNGSRPATVMHQLAKGYTPEQLAALAAYFAAQR